MAEVIEKQLYNGTETLFFYPLKHYYLRAIGDRKELVLSVSSICGVVDKSQPLIYRATNLAKDYLLGLSPEERTDEEVVRACLKHKEKKEESADIGTQAHARAENYIKTGAVSLPEDQRVANAVNGFLSWITENEVKFEKSELLVYSKEDNYVGITDAIGSVNGKRYLIDFKTSNKIRLLEYGMQTSAYKKAYEEETGDKLDGILIVKFAKEEADKDGNPIAPFEVQEVVDIDYFFNAFKSAKVLKEAVKKYDKF